MGVVCVVEKGNTRWKIAAFNLDQITSVEASALLNLDLIRTLNPSKVILSGSGSWSEEDEESLRLVCDNLHIYRYGDNSRLHSKVKDITSLGTDRVANSYAVASVIEDYMNERRAWLIVDVGTCVTCDLVVDGIHQGGSISPGIDMRLQSMHEGTAALPDVKVTAERGPGLDTQSALTEGALGGIEAEVTGRWHILREKHPDLGIILTGGGSSNLELGELLPKFADSNLTLKGYYALLQ